MYCAVDQWDEIFPATIAAARVTETGSNWQRIEVTHKIEGRVANTLIVLSDTVIALEESKRRFDASFLNQFQPAAHGGTRYVITAHIRLKSILRTFQSLLAGYVRRKAREQMRQYVLEPLKTAVESDDT